MKMTLVSIFLMLTSSIASASTLSVKIVDFKNYKGRVQVALWNSPSGFPDDYNTAYITRTEIAERGFSLNIENLSAGEYAVAMYHDKNSNTQMDTNFFGIPKEGFGFSNNPLILTGPPSFSKAKFSIGSNQKKTITIKLKHFL
jgi:uncharacterized protein (DUF2141 family)